MENQIYLPEITRTYYKSTVQSFHDIFIQKLYPSFGNIEQDAELIADKYYNKIGELPGDGSFDMSEAAEIAQDMGISYYMEVRLVKYEFTALSIASLYHLWEQQIRKFLFDEISKNRRIDFSSFCPLGYNQIKNILLQFGIDIKSFNCFDQLDELRLLCNTIKHGDGNSAQKLKTIKPDYFRIPEFDIPIDLPLDSTLLEENIIISEEDFSRFLLTIRDWWDEFPERTFCDNLKV